MRDKLEKYAFSFYKEFLKRKRLQNPSYEENIRQTFGGITAIASSFVHVLLQGLFQLDPTKHFIYFVGITSKTGGSNMGLFPGIYTREELINAINGCFKSIEATPAFFKKEGDE
jgi:hypothetical protein